ncbi:pyridoxamine 5'-phosphate oxidase family protein [uncultured Pseudodesulfovibrio sp.]|uniref:pyridoxamine 5'-phosphate oxidase family protein n=1 Tax=uncultured Pseudodesulfovibrio sp. TaxID=2035858 RepID=UPI0029C6AE7B|nr:pyridoxamine 5'-phosphate oxidase family protein [uncultured Pseudodesulfovibrio sp.]
MSKNKLQIIDDLVLGKDICVLGTSDGRNPHVSLMAFLVDHAAMKFYFLSRKNSHKSQNIKKCPHVSILIDTREEHLPDNRDKAMALTIQGVYAPINKPQTIKAITKHFLAKYPDMEEFAAHPDTELIRIKAKSGQLVCGLEDEFSTKFKNS